MVSGIPVGSDTWYGYTTVTPLLKGYRVSVTVPDYANDRTNKIVFLATKLMFAGSKRTTRRGKNTTFSGVFYRMERAVNVALEIQEEK